MQLDANTLLDLVRPDLIHGLACCGIAFALIAGVSLAVMIRLGNQGYSEPLEPLARIALVTLALAGVSVMSAALLHWI
jgi:multidrug transporter EmrE-like cation transporter